MSNASTSIDWQGHRGARGLLPENTIPAFIKALAFPKVKTLELDVVISKDKQVIVSHEPWMSHHICSKPDGSPVTAEEAEQLLIYHMDYEEIKKYDCGSRGNHRFPEQQAISIHKPSLMDMVSQVELYCKQHNKTAPFYNIELKSQPEYYGIRVPQPAEFVRLVLDELDLLNIKDRVNLQSFDLNILKAIKQQEPGISLALLIENTDTPERNLERLGFVPNIYSPYFMLINEDVVEYVHGRGMKLIPWTINDTETMKRLVAIGVDGIITDYPNLIPE
jgi:glycerophosphoryl diester phosphodiesterase